MRRAEARALGLTKYDTGKPCKQGHYSARNTKTAKCHHCVRIATKRRRLADPEGHRAKERALYNSKTAAARHQRRYANPETRQREIGASKRWNRDNPGRVAFNKSRERARKLGCEPAWLIDEQIDAMRKIYIAASLIGGEYHVDHIIPLAADDVSGLHVPWNLQILTGTENRTKGRRFKP